MKLAEWLESAAVAAQQIASEALAARELHWSGLTRDPLPGDVCGIYIPLMMDGIALQLGVLATRDVCAALASALLGGDEPMESDEDVFDAVGEIANLIAGTFKVLLADQLNVRVGVPLAMKGRVITLGGSQSLHGVLAIDQRSVWLAMAGTKTR
ncbi:MAG TPA: chemotaxis protein CheX [Polyangiaceae bacterium]|nr:chemotaxis protein CheX [Polyangiaceae bacterium]